MNSEKSFSQRLKNGQTKEQLQKYYSLSSYQYDKVLECLQDLKKNRGK